MHYLINLRYVPHFTGLRLAALMTALAFPALATAAAEDDIRILREQVRELRQNYEQRVQALEQRLKEAEDKTAQSPVARAGADGDLAPTLNTRSSGFSPEISLILQGKYEQKKSIAERGITGFWPGGHNHDGDTRGFSIDHSELTVAANIDPNFRGQTTIALADDEVEIEEAFFQTLNLGRGITAKGGRFLSGIGYQNEQHAHAWDFSNTPLMYQALFGEHGYAVDGAQLKWVAPTDLFVELGGEIGRGANFPGTDRNRNGKNSGSVFAHLGGDVGRSNSWRTGLSWLTTRAENRDAHFEDSDVAGPNEVHGLFSGRSRTWIADVVWKWAPNGDASRRHLKLQAEYFRRKENGALACVSEVATSPCNGEPSGSYDSHQSGWYAQAVYQFMPQWRIGYRYDRLDSGTVSASLADEGTLDSESAPLVRFRPHRHSVMVDWSPSEFSRLRLQYADDKSMAGLTDKQWTLQYVMSLGEHGAHKF